MWGCEMKTYEVEIKRTSFVTVTVEALNEAHAEEEAHVEIDLQWAHIDAEWQIQSIKEVVK